MEKAASRGASGKKIVSEASKVFTCVKGLTVAVVVAFNRGHAVKMLAKQFKDMGLDPLTDADPVTEIDLTANKKGQVVMLRLHCNCAPM